MKAEDRRKMALHTVLCPFLLFVFCFLSRKFIPTKYKPAGAETALLRIAPATGGREGSVNNGKLRLGRETGHQALHPVRPFPVVFRAVEGLPGYRLADVKRKCAAPLTEKFAGKEQDFKVDF